MNNDIQLPAWYESTQGPIISQTLIYIVGNILPIINLVFSSKGVNILPESINVTISVLVFVAFSIKAAVGYIKAKKILGAQIQSMGRIIKNSTK